MKIAFCDDNPIEMMILKNYFEKATRSNLGSVSIEVRFFASADEVLRAISKSDRYDLFVLDILMPGMNGIELAKEIRQLDERCRIVFLTSTPEYALASYQVHADDYLLKPVQFEDLTQLLKRCAASLDKESKDGLLVRDHGSLRRVRFHEIRYAESLKHTILLHLTNATVLSYYGSIKELNLKLENDPRFMQCHKSFIVNLDHIDCIEQRDFRFEDGQLVPISKEKIRCVKEKFAEYVSYKT